MIFTIALLIILLVTITHLAAFLYVEYRAWKLAKRESSKKRIPWN